MAKRKKVIIPFRRKREGRTDYSKRLILLKSSQPRLVVRKSLKNLSVQIIGYKEGGDSVLVSAHSRELVKFGWTGYRCNISAAYLTGLLCGGKAKKAGISGAIMDSGLYVSSKGTVVYAALKGAIDSGLSIPHSDELMPPPERIKGGHLKRGAENFEQVKEKIIKGGSK